MIKLDVYIAVLCISSSFCHTYVQIVMLIASSQHFMLEIIGAYNVNVNSICPTR